MRYLIILPKYCLLLVLFASCDDFLDVNENTDAVNTAPPNFLLPPILSFYANNVYSDAETSAYFTQHVATLSGFSSVRDRWDYRTAFREGTFRRHFHDVAVNANHLIETGRKEGSGNYEAVGHIMMVFTTQSTTDILGQIPYREALKGNPSPPYDEQEVIYDGILKEIDLAIRMLSEVPDPGDRPMTLKEDRLYGGDLTAWLGLAHAEKARILLHLTPNINQNYQAVIDEVNLAFQTWKDPVYTYANDESMTLSINGWGPARTRFTFEYEQNELNTSAPTQFLLETVLGYDPVNHVVDDPRTPFLMSANENNRYLSVRPSEGRDPSIMESSYPNLYDTYYTSNNSPIVYLTTEELYFMRAEAYFQSGNAANAYNDYIAGIRAHTERLGVDDADVNTFLSDSPLIAQNSGALELSDIMIQKWLALYLQPESWVDMRRHQYDPRIYVGLERPANLAEFWSPDDDSEWIQRIIYDNQTEEIYNRGELERLGAFQNPDWLKVPLWWAERN